MKRQPFGQKKPSPPADPAVTAPDSAPVADKPNEAPKRAPEVGVIDLVPPRVLFGSLAVAGVVAIIAASLVGTGSGGAAPAVDSQAAAAAASALDSDSTFAFKYRGARMAETTCVMTFEVTGGTSDARRITVHVMDTAGAVITQTSRDVPTLARGLFLDFQFPNANCDAIDSWQFQGEGLPATR